MAELGIALAVAFSVDSRAYLTVVSVAGHLDYSEAVSIRRAVESYGRTTDRVRLDLNEATADVSALRDLLTGLAETARRVGFGMEVRASGELRRALEDTGVAGRVALI